MFWYSEFPWLILQQACPVREGEPVERMSMVCALSRSCAPHRLESSRSVWKRGGQTNVCYWLSFETSLMPSPFLATYNCRRIHVKVPPPHTHRNTPCKGHLKKQNKTRKDFWINAFKPDSVWGFTKNAISVLRRNWEKRATEETSYGTLLPPRVQWVHRLRNKSLNVLFTRAIFYSAVGWPLKAIVSRSTT